jgi:hypothetical protein
MPLVLLSLAGGAVGVSAHGGGAAFTAKQHGQTRIEPRQLDAMLMTTREPVPHGVGSAATGVACEAVIGEKLSTVEGRLYRGLEKLRVELNA